MRLKLCDFGESCCGHCSARGACTHAAAAAARVRERQRAAHHAPRLTPAAALPCARARRPGHQHARGARGHARRHARIRECCPQPGLVARAAPRACTHALPCVPVCLPPACLPAYLPSTGPLCSAPSHPPCARPTHHLPFLNLTRLWLLCAAQMAPEVLNCPFKNKPEENKGNRLLHYSYHVDTVGGENLWATCGGAHHGVCCTTHTTWTRWGGMHLVLG